MATPEKRMVLVTKESMFYVPERHSSPIQTRAVSKVTTPLDQTDSIFRGTEDAEAEPEEIRKPVGCYQALYHFGLCAFLLVLLGLLLVFDKREDSSCLLLVVVLAGALGYSIAHVKMMLS
jgi:hypothetical protein